MNRMNLTNSYENSKISKYRRLWQEINISRNLENKAGCALRRGGSFKAFNLRPLMGVFEGIIKSGDVKLPNN